MAIQLSLNAQWSNATDSELVSLDKPILIVPIELGNQLSLIAKENSLILTFTATLADHSSHAGKTTMNR